MLQDLTLVFHSNVTLYVLIFCQFKNAPHPIFAVPADGVYLLVVKMTAVSSPMSVEPPFSANVKVQMRSEHGYLSAADYPLLSVSKV